MSSAFLFISENFSSVSGVRDVSPALRRRALQALFKFLSVVRRAAPVDPPEPPREIRRVVKAAERGYRPDVKRCRPKQSLRLVAPAL